MLILIDDDFSHTYIYIYPNWTNKNCFHFFLSLDNEKFKMAATDKQKSGFRYIITDNEHKKNKINVICCV